MICVTVQGQQEAEARRVAALKAAQGGGGDSPVSAAVAGLRDAARAALNAQGEDPDNETDPRDAAVWSHLEDAQDAAAEAERDQAMDVPTGAHAAAEGAMDAASEKARASGPDGRFTRAGSGIPAPGGARTADSFRRPYLDAGHAAPGHGSPHSAPLPDGQPEPRQFHRGYIEAGHAAPSPGQGAPHSAPAVMHVNLTGDRGTMHAIHPAAPSGPGGQHS